MESIKAWLIETLIKIGGPSAIRGAILGISAWLLAKNNILSTYGIVSDAAAHTTTVYWDKVSVALVLLLPAAIAAVIKMVNSHASSAVKTAVAPPKGDQPQ